MSRHRPTIFTFLVGLVGLVGLAVVVSTALASNPDRRELNGTIWVANRGAHTIRGFDASRGDVVATVAMRAGSQPGDLAYAKGRLYVAEEFGSPPAIAVVDAASGRVLSRIFTGPRPPPRARERRRESHRLRRVRNQQGRHHRDAQRHAAR